MKKIKSGFFEYTADLTLSSSLCWYDLLINNSGRDIYIVVFTELVRNKGKSITNSIEYLATSFIKNEAKISLDCATFLFIERYENHPEYIEWVFLDYNGTFSNPKWNQASVKEFNSINPCLTNIKDIPLNESKVFGKFPKDNFPKITPSSSDNWVKTISLEKLQYDFYKNSINQYFKGQINDPNGFGQ